MCDASPKLLNCPKPIAAFNQFYSIRRVLENALNVLDHRLSGSERLQRIETSLTEVGLDPVDVLSKLANPQHDYTKRLLADVPRLHGWGAVLIKPNVIQ